VIADRTAYGRPTLANYIRLVSITSLRRTAYARSDSIEFMNAPKLYSSVTNELDRPKFSIALEVTDPNRTVTSMLNNLINRAICKIFTARRHSLLCRALY